MVDAHSPRLSVAAVVYRAANSTLCWDPDHRAVKMLAFAVSVVRPSGKVTQVRSSDANLTYEDNRAFSKYSVTIAVYRTATSLLFVNNGLPCR